MEHQLENQLYINELVEQNHVDEQTIKMFQTEIDNFIANHYSCNPKTSFKNCKQEIKGYEKTLVFENGQFYEKLVPCAHMIKQLEKDKILDRFVFVDFDPLKKESFLLFNTIRLQNDFYHLDPNQNWDEIKPIISDKNEFKNKSLFVEEFLEQMKTKPEFSKGKYLVGNMGIGKTNLLKFLTLMAANNYQKTVAFTNVNVLINYLKEGFSEQNININKFLRKLSNVDVLVLDDIGSEQVTKWVRDDVLFTLLNSRMENHRLTYFTSNLTWDELEKHYYKINETDVNKKINVDRLMERIKALSSQFKLLGTNHRY